MAKRTASATTAETDVSPRTDQLDSSAETGTTDGDLGTVAAEAVEQVQATAGHFVDQVKHLATGRLSEQQKRLAGGLALSADLLRAAGKQVREQDQPTVAQYIEGAADRVEHFSDTVREQDASQIVSKTEEIARRRPALFLSGGLALGFLGARFFQSSATRQEEIERQAAERQEAKRRREAERSATALASAAGQPADAPPATIPLDDLAPYDDATLLPPYAATIGDISLDSAVDLPVAPDNAVLEVVDVEWDLGVAPVPPSDQDPGRRE